MVGAYRAEGIHIERRLLSAVLVACVFSMAFQTNVYPLVNIQIENAESASPGKQSILSDANTAIELTWTSRWEPYPQEVLNNSELVGDHVVLNATFLGQAGFVAPYEMTMNITGINTTISSSDSSIVYDTYPSRYNFTTSVSIRIENGVNEAVIGTFLNISVCNFFSPSLSRIRVEELEPDYQNISWSSEDLNADDINIYTLWFSIDGGGSFLSLAMNLTSSQFLWNMSGWLDLDYFVRVRAYSVDLSYFGGPFIDIPDDYWPGDCTDGYSPFFAHSGPIPGFADVGVIPASDLTYYWGGVDNIIEWHLTFERPYIFQMIPDSLPYTVTHNGKSYFSGTQSIGYDFVDARIIVQIDGLSLGVHNFTLTFADPGGLGGIVSDTVEVTVQLSPELYVIGVTGIGALLIVTAALITRSRRRQI